MKRNSKTERKLKVKRRWGMKIEKNSAMKYAKEFKKKDMGNKE